MSVRGAQSVTIVENSAKMLGQESFLGQDLEYSEVDRVHKSEPIYCSNKKQ